MKVFGSVSRRLMGLIVAPLDRLVFAVRLFTGMPGMVAGVEHHGNGPRQERGEGRLHAVWGSGERERWPTVRIELPPEAELVSSMTGVGLRYSVWSSPGTAEDVASFFRLLFDETGVQYHEDQRRNYLVLRPLGVWEDVEIRIARYDTAPVMINVRQFLYRRPGGSTHPS